MLARLGGISVAVLLVLGSASSAEAQTLVGGTTAWTVVGAPAPSTSCLGPCELLSFSNHLSVNVTGIVFMVLRNNSSQTISISIATATIASGGIAEVALVETGVPPGAYNATFFAVAFSGVAISLPTTATFTVA